MYDAFVVKSALGEKSAISVYENLDDTTLTTIGLPFVESGWVDMKPAQVRRLHEFLSRRIEQLEAAELQRHEQAERRRTALLQTWHPTEL